MPIVEGEAFVIEGEVITAGTFQVKGNSWQWRDKEGAVTLGNVYVFDAAGKEIPAQMSVSATRTKISLNTKDLQDATYPVIIDPEIGNEDFRISNASDRDASYDAEQTDVAYNSDDDQYLVVWRELSGEYEVYGQLIDGTDGSEIGSDFRISDMGPNSDLNYAVLTPAVTYNSDAGEYLVVWPGEDNVGGTVNNAFEIFGQRINATTGAEVGTNDFRISDMGAADNDADFDADEVRVVYNPTAEEYLVMWVGDDDTGSLVNEEDEVYVQRLNGSDCTEVGTNDQRISDMGGADGDNGFRANDIDLVYNPEADEYLAVWSGDDTTDEEHEVFVQRLKGSDASELGNNDQKISDMGPDTNTAYDALLPAVTYNSTAEEYLVVWSSDDNTGSLVDGENEVFGQRLRGSDVAELGTNDFRISDMGPDGNNAYDVISGIDVVYNTLTDEYYVVWDGDDDTGDLVDNEVEIYGQRLNGSDVAEVGTNDVRISEMGPDGTNGYFAFAPKIAFNSTSGEYFVVFYGDTNTGGLSDNEQEVFGQRIDEAPPAAPTTPDIIAASDLGSSTTDNKTSDSTPTVSGTAESGSTVTIQSSIDGNVGSAVATGGTYSITASTLTQGVHSLSAFATDTVGNIGSTSSALSATIDTTNPASPTISSPTTGTETSDDTPTVSGTTEANATVELFSDNTSVGSTTANGSGAWSIVSQTLANGSRSLKAQTTDVAGNVSSLSSAVTITVDDTDTDGDGTPDLLDADDDNDGVSDTQEATDGTNPLDSGSVRETLATSFCSEWNGFLGGMWNILEFVNVTSNSRTVESTLKSISGETQSINEVTVAAGGQTDVLVHSMTGWTENSYGQVCASVTNGSAGDVDGRMVYYKPNSPSSTTSSDIQFAFALPYQNGLAGSQFVFFNTYQPSLDAADASNTVTNWIQLLNLDSNEQGGTLYYYGQDGSELASEEVTLGAGARSDFSGHQFGTNLVGVIEWRPTSSSAVFQMKNIRYFYDNAVLTDSFDAAFQLGGARGSGELLIAPVDTSIGTSVLEVGNTNSSSITVSVKVYSEDGTIVETLSPELDAYASQHIILDSILTNAKGIVTVDGSAAGSTVATVMSYGRTATNGISFLYGIQATQPLGTALRGSYNTYLGQSCRLLVSSTTAQTVQISVTRSDGTELLENSEQEVAENGLLDFDLCGNDEANNYGVVTVQPETTNTISAHVVRVGEDSYRFPTALR